MTEHEFWQTVIRHAKGIVAHLGGIVAALAKYKLGEQKKS